jgi:hypothetical protein
MCVRVRVRWRVVRVRWYLGDLELALAGDGRELEVGEADLAGPGVHHGGDVEPADGLGSVRHGLPQLRRLRIAVLVRLLRSHLRKRYVNTSHTPHDTHDTHSLRRRRRSCRTK